MQEVQNEQEVQRSHSMKHELRLLLYGRSSQPTLVNDILIGANLFIILESLVGLVIGTSPILRHVEFAFGILFAAEYLARFWISRHKQIFVFRMVNMVELIVISSLLLTEIVPNLAFLRVLRALQILRAYKLLGKRFDHHSEFIRRNFEVVTAVVNILVFLVIMSTVVFVQQAPINPDIVTYVDAVYFTIATLTTTGFGDIIAVGTFGKVTAIVIMILGVTLFFRLVKSIFVPRNLYSVCSGCGNDSHPLTAHFCHQCGFKIKNQQNREHYQMHKDDF